MRRALERADHPWLLVFDNADGEAAITDFIPNGRHSHVTSRNPHWTVATPLEVTLWIPDQSWDYLRPPGRTTARPQRPWPMPWGICR